MKTQRTALKTTWTALSFAALMFMGTSCVYSDLSNAFDPQAFPLLNIAIGLEAGSGNGGGGGGDCRYDQSNFDNCTFSD